MPDDDSTGAGLVQELRRRRVFTTAGLYVVGAWLVMQAADVFFPGWDIPDRGINVLLIAAIAGFPLALVFGWFFNVTGHGIRRTLPVDSAGSGGARPLKGNDYFVLGTLLLAAGAVISYATVQILSIRGVAPPPVLVEKVPNSIAVLPFVNLSDDPDNEYFCDGISEEILNRLAAHAELHVIGRTSSFVFKDSDYGIPRISALLGVRYLLQGSVRKAGDRLRISAQLVDDSGAQQWGGSFDRTLTDIFAIQTEIADLVASTVVPQIVPEAPLYYEPSVAAYEHFLAGRELFYQRERQQAREELRKAIDLDPGFAEPYAEWAIATLFGFPDELELEKAREAIQTALTLHPGMPRALAAQGLLLEQQRPPDYQAAEAVLRKVLEQNPNMTDAMNWLAIALTGQGKWNEANALRHRAYGLDPLHPSVASNLMAINMQTGHLVRAYEITLRSVEMPDPSQLSLRHMVWSSVLLARWDEAEDYIQRILGRWPGDVVAPWLAGIVNLERGHYRAALDDFDRYVASGRVDLEEVLASDSYLYGIFLAMAGDYEQAVQVMGLDYERPPRALGEFELDAQHALALALIGIGEGQRARTLLESIEEAAAELPASEQQRNPMAYILARNAALLGDKALALDRLKLAIEAGWRGYYVENHDPRWSTMADDPRFQAMMAEVKADVDRQRAEVEAIRAGAGLSALAD